MSKQVLVKRGFYAKKEVVNQVFSLVKPVSHGKNGLFVTVDGSEITGQPGRNIRVLLNSMTDVEYDGAPTETEVEPVPVETDEEAMARIRKSFMVLDKMSDAVARGVVRGLVVSGPPGVGKSHDVEKVIDAYETMHRLKGGIGNATETIKGSVTAIGLYKTFWDNRNKGNVVVFDDSDSILFDELSLNLLKAVLDTGKKRTLTWKAESNALREDGIPTRFEFEGGVIFITNLDFENVSSKKIAPHLAAVMSRCHYIDLEMNSERDRFLRIEQIVADGMLENYDFGPHGAREIVDFMKERSKELREISLRMVVKLADLKQMEGEGWKELAESTCLKRLS